MPPGERDCWLPHDSGAGLCWQHVGGVGSTTTTLHSILIFAQMSKCYSYAIFILEEVFIAFRKEQETTANLTQLLIAAYLVTITDVKSKAVQTNRQPVSMSIRDRILNLVLFTVIYGTGGRRPQELINHGSQAALVDFWQILLGTEDGWRFSARQLIIPLSHWLAGAIMHNHHLLIAGLVLLTIRESQNSIQYIE